MAEAPSLSEIINIARQPGEGDVSPRTLIDTSQLVHTVNQQAQFKAENDWRKYSAFMNDLKGVYKELGDLQGMEVAQADRPALQKEAASIFKEIGDNPGAFFGGKMAEVEQKIGKLRSLSAQSVQDNIFDQAHRAYIERDPSLQSDENKSLIEGYFKQPLGQRKAYMLKLPSLYNPQAIANQINAVIPQKFSNTGLSPDGKYLNTVTGIRYDEKQFKTLADQMYFSLDPQTGRTIGNEAADRLKALPENIQNYYKKKYPEDPVKGFFDETVMPWKKPDQIEGTKSTGDPFAIEQYKAKDQLEKMRIKFGYDKVLEEMKIGGAKEVTKLRAKLSIETHAGKVGALKGMVETMVNDAKKGTPVTTPEGTFYKLPVSSAMLKSYASKEGVLKKEVKPDEMLISDDGMQVKQIYYNQPGKPESGVNESKSRLFGVDEFTTRFGKDVLGVSATEKEINADDDTDDESAPEQTPAKEKYPLPKGKPRTVTQGGFTYTYNSETGQYQ